MNLKYLSLIDNELMFKFGRWLKVCSGAKNKK